MQRTAMAMVGCLLLACGAPNDADPVTGSDTSSALTLEPHARSAAEVPVCHRAGGRWVPLRLPEAAVQSHVGRHGDFVYDASAGQCCTDAECGPGLSCRHAAGLDGVSLIGMCPRAHLPGPTDPTAFLLAMSLFGAVDGTTPPVAATLRRATDDQGDHYSLRFPVNGILVNVALATFVPRSGTTLYSSETQVFVTFPARNAGLITFDAISFKSFLNLKLKLSPTDDSLLGTGTVDLINATVANFTLDITPGDPSTYPVVLLDSGDPYSVLGIRGVYVQPTSYIGNGSGPAGFYLNLLNGTVTAQVLVFREAVYDVRL